MGAEMKFKLPIFLVLGITAAESCERTHHGRDTYLSVGGAYCMNATLLEDTCSCGGLPAIPNPNLVNFLQETSNGMPAAGVEIDAAIVGYFGGVLAKGGYFSTRFEDMEDIDPDIDRLCYDGVFTGTSEDAVFANHHATVGPENGEPCEEEKPCHFRVDFHRGSCADGGSCYFVLKLSGRKMNEGEYYCTNAGE